MKLMILLISLIFSVSLFASQNFAEESTMKEFFLENCNSCHGEKSVDLNSPILYGQDKSYVLKQLSDFRSGYRYDNIMHGRMNEIAKPLTEAEIDKLATYLSGLSPCDYPPKQYELPGDPVAGEVVAQSCTQCHHTWIPGMKVPHLYGQKPLYIYKTLNAFKFSRRENSEQMAHQTSALSEKQIRDVSSYFGQRLECTIHEKF